MSGRRNLQGINAIVIGVLAVMLIAFVKQIELARETHAGYLLRWMDRLGLIADGSRDESRLKAWDPFSLNDDTALTAVFGFGIYLAVAAMASALWARRRGEDNLFLSAGFMCASCALVLADYTWGMAAMFGGAFVMALLRERRT